MYIYTNQELRNRTNQLKKIPIAEISEAFLGIKICPVPGSVECIGYSMSIFSRCTWKSKAAIEDITQWCLQNFKTDPKM